MPRANRRATPSETVAATTPTRRNCHHTLWRKPVVADTGRGTLARASRISDGGGAPSTDGNGGEDVRADRRPTGERPRAAAAAHRGPSHGPRWTRPDDGSPPSCPGGTESSLPVAAFRARLRASIASESRGRVPEGERDQDVADRERRGDGDHDRRSELRSDRREPVQWTGRHHVSLKAYPTPWTVRMKRGSLPSSPIFRRSRATCESTTRPPA